MSEEMTREQAIKELKNIRDNFNYTLCPNDVFDMAITALSAEPCEDAISRQAAIRIAKEECENGSYNDIPWKLEGLPSVNPQDCNTCEVGNPCLYCKHEFEPQESEMQDADSD